MHSCVTAEKPIPVAAVLKSQKDEERMVTFHPGPERSSPQGITARGHPRGGGACAAPGLLLGRTSVLNTSKDNNTQAKGTKNWLQMQLTMKSDFYLGIQTMCGHGVRDCLIAKFQAVTLNQLSDVQTGGFSSSHTRSQLFP